jgi:hypothetical protein
VLLLSLLVRGQTEAHARDDRDAPENLDRDAAARGFFDEGLAHADGRRWGEAAASFERARQLRASPEITYNLTTALAHTGRLVRASQLLREIADDGAAVPAVRAAARARLEELRPRLAYLTLASRRADWAGWLVTLDGQALALGQLGVALPVDPVSHSVVLRQGEALRGRSEIILDEGERRTVSLDVMAFPVAYGEASASAPAQGVVATTAPTPAAGKAWIWIVGGALAIGAATAVVLATRDGGSAAPPSGNVDTWVLGK